jgi:hypothetical protein
MQRPEIRQVSEMPFSDQSGFVTGALQKR